MIKQLTAIIVCFAFFAPRSGAQELRIDLSGGLEGTRYTFQDVLAKQLPGGSLGLSYSFRLARNWNLLTGVAGGIYRTQATLNDGIVFSSYQVDDAGSAFRYDVKATGYKETQQFFAATVPLLLQYHTTGNRTQWYFDAGARALLPASLNIRQSARQLSLSGYYPDYNLEVTNLPEHGFGVINNWKGSQTAQLKPAIALSASTGMSFRISSGTRLYLGVYVAYGLNDLKGGTDSLPFAAYSASGVSQTQTSSVIKMSGAGPMTALSFGVQLRLGFSTSGARRAARKQANAEPQDSTIISLNERDTAVVLFGTLNETTILERQKLLLNEVASILKQHPNVRISLVGHICNSGGETEDVRVGEERAKAVANYLRRKGIDKDRMAVSWLSESDPVLPNNPSANYRNRKVVIKVQ
jgi:OmpA-OmpF porin, OOP family